MIKYDRKVYADGVAAARHAIANGVPRWIMTTGSAFGEVIHADTGLPIAGLSAAPNLETWQQSYAQGFNDETLAAVESETIDVDFRPLLMTRDEVEHALDTCLLGTISSENPNIDSPNGDFSLGLDQPKSNSKPNQTTWICYQDTSGNRWPKYAVYDGPLRVALGKDGSVLVFETKSLYLTRDLVTTQVLNRYLLR